MAGEPQFHDSSPLHASNSRALQNSCPTSPPSSAHSLQSRFPGRPETVPHAFHLPLAQKYSSFDQRSSHLVIPSRQLQRLENEPRDSEEDEQQYEEAPREEEQGLEEDRSRGTRFEQENGSLMSGKGERCRAHLDQEALPFVVRRHMASRDAALCVSQAFESQRASGDEGGAEDSIDEGSQSNSVESLQGESENYSNEQSDGSSSGKDMVNHLSLHDDEKGRVSPLRALSHIAHIKRKQDYLQNDVEQMQPDGTNQFGVDAVRESSSKRKRLKHVQFQLEPLAYQKLMNILVEQHQGSFERFIMATLESISMEAHPARRAATAPRKLALSKWKRTRFDQLKGTETEELALAFRSLAESTPNVEVTSDLMHVPWQELNMLQVQKMLEETKKLLLVNEKVHDCPFADCGRRFSTPGNLRDHLNEHSGEQPYGCTFEDCPLRFRSKQHLCRHLKKHERAHTCTFEGCNKRFAFRERLIVHQKIHSDERPLSCPWEGCGKTFKWANSLHGHMRTHTGEKPFQCTFAGCGRFFGYKVDLTRHRRTHFGQPARANH